MIYVLKPLEEAYDKYSISSYTEVQGYVIVAPSAEDARQLAYEAGDTFTRRPAPWWLDCQVTTCEPIIDNGEPRIILADTPTG